MAPSRRCFDGFVNPVTKGADLEAQQIYNEVEGTPCQQEKDINACFFFVNLFFVWVGGAMNENLKICYLRMMMTKLPNDQ